MPVSYKKYFPLSLRKGLLGWSLILLAGCGGGSSSQPPEEPPPAPITAFDWRVPAIYPLPQEPADNRMTEAKFQLGRHLFYDSRLSGNGTQSCASCHHQDKAFSDGIALPKGSTGQSLVRNSQALVNVGYNPTLTWANPSLLSIEHQILIPLFGENPVEQGITDGNQAAILQQIREDKVYTALFLNAYPERGGSVSLDAITQSIACFVRGLISFDSPFDRHQQGDASALSAEALRGKELFFSEKLECFHCHGGYNFSDSTIDRNTTQIERPFHNTGLFNIGGSGLFPADNPGIFELTGKPEDMGKFRAVTLRNIALTAPYMHDGSMATLAAVVDFYAAGGRVIETGPYAGDGRLSPFKDGFISGFSLTEAEKADLIAFLQSLTDLNFVTSARFSNPWPANSQ